MVVTEHIRRAAQQYPNHVAAICDGERRTHGELDSRSSQLANALIALGLARGDRVVVLLENSIRCIEVDFGLAKAALVRVSLNPRVQAAELAYILDDAEPKAVIFGSNFENLMLAAAAQRPAIRYMICVEEPGTHLQSEICITYEVMLTGVSSLAPELLIADEDLHSLAYTSGSTGKPKGVMLTHRAIVQVAYNVLIELGPESPGERVLLLQPLSHGSAYFVLAYFIRGCAIVLMRQFNARGALALLRDLDIETMKLVPTMLHRMLALPDIESIDFPKLRQIVYGGSHIATDSLKKAIAIFGPRLAQHYGQTEAPSTLTVLPRHEHTLENLQTGLLASAGRPFATVEAKIVDDGGAPVKLGDIGELIVRAPHMMAGYWKRDDLSKTVVRDGWLHTNDLARFDSRGYMYLLGRKDDMIISGGFNIAPREVEEALCTHPAVNEVAVFGRPDPDWGQSVVAVVSLRDKTTTRNELVEHTRACLGYKRPKDIVIVDELPKNPNGKIDKTALKRAHGGA